jgi:uncharacterized membrane protein
MIGRDANPARAVGRANRRGPTSVDKDRLLAFSDGVIAIIITIMVLELKVPHGDDWAALAKLLPIFLSYVLSFVYVAIYWNNHHHMMHTATRVTGATLWANMHLLFWLSLVPFATGWMGENHFTTLPVAVYGFAMLMAGIAYYVLEQHLVRLHGAQSHLARAVGHDVKGKLSVLLYLLGIALAFVKPWLAVAVYAAVALMWFIPDRRIERQLQ